jgi:hypothetical protein
MRAIIWAASVAMALAGCESLPKGLKDHPSVSCYDTNGDGLVDYELHHPMKQGDIEWALVDENYDGYYDYSILYGDTIGIKEPVHIPVPRGIHFTKYPTEKSSRAKPPKT